VPHVCRINAAGDEEKRLKLTPKPLRVLIVPDKFKGTLPASDVATAIGRGWKAVRTGDQLEFSPMSDGGDGFGDVLAMLLKTQPRSVKTLDAAHRPIKARWWWKPDKKLAIFEAARVIGLSRLPKKAFHPFQLDTFGLGRLFANAVRAGAKRCVIGIGGSATNDAGFGLARALGWKFFDRAGRELKQWWQLHELARVTPPASAIRLDICVAVDVFNPLLGPRGCTRVYGPQKGIRPEDLAFAEKCLRRLAAVARRQLGLAHAATPGAGAAGGLGFGLMTFAGGKPQSGFDVFANAAHLEKRIRAADLVITGEGAVDRQTCMGKGVGEVALLCQALKTPCLALAGVITEPRRASKLFSRACALTDITTLNQAKKRTEFHLQQLSAMAARSLAIS
jgi:glycerate 2-kinase